MAITLAQALTERSFHDDGGCPINADHRGKDKGPAVWRRNGKTQTWKTRPTDFGVPVKFGLHDYAQITPFDNNVHVAADCPRES